MLYLIINTSIKMIDKQLAGLSKTAQNKKQEALEKTEKAIAKLTSNRQKITIRSVAREAQVSVSYIYKYPELAYKIQRLREQQKYNLVVRNQENRNNQYLVEQLRQEKKELELENSQLKAIIERVKTGKKSLKDLQAENIQLVTENVRLKKELEHTVRSLQSAREFILKQGHLDLNQAEIETENRKIHKISEE